MGLRWPCLQDFKLPWDEGLWPYRSHLRGTDVQPGLGPVGRADTPEGKRGSRRVSPYRAQAYGEGKSLGSSKAGEGEGRAG